VGNLSNLLGSEQMVRLTQSEDEHVQTLSRAAVEYFKVKRAMWDQMNSQRTSN